MHRVPPDRTVHALREAVTDPGVIERYPAKIVTMPGHDCWWWSGAVAGRGQVGSGSVDLGAATSRSSRTVSDTPSSTASRLSSAPGSSGIDVITRCASASIPGMSSHRARHRTESSGRIVVTPSATHSATPAALEAARSPSAAPCVRLRPAR